MAIFPVTQDELIESGQRFSSVDVIRQTDELLPLARAYVSVLSGYDEDMLEDLIARRTVLVGLVAARRNQRKGEKVGSRKEETRILRAARWLHREAVVVVRNAIRTRVPAAGETPDQTRAIVAELTASLAAQQGSMVLDAAVVQTRLEGTIGLFSLVPLQDRLVKLSKGKDYPAELRAMIDQVASATHGKTGAQQKALLDTAEMDEIDGRIYVNLKALVESGRAYFHRLGDTTKASLFNLNILNGTAPAPAPGGGGGAGPGPGSGPST
jgi:hypothetical protein